MVKLMILAIFAHVTWLTAAVALSGAFRVDFFLHFGPRSIIFNTMSIARLSQSP
jgi:hypothetical protein